MRKTSGSFFSEVLNCDFLNSKNSITAKTPNFPSPLISKTGNKKSSLFYNTHSYPTKVPVEDICEYVERHTKPGDVIMDPFCGSGMTALATKLMGRNGYFSDLGTLAMHLTFNHVRECDTKALKTSADLILNELRQNDNPYAFTYGKSNLELKTVIFSSVSECLRCNDEIAFWDVAIDPQTFDLKKEKKCPSCNSDLDRSEKKSIYYSPVQFTYGTFEAKSYKHSAATPKLLQTTDFHLPKKWRLSVPDIKVGENREMYIRSALKLHGIDKLSDFYTPRNLYALDKLYRLINQVSNIRIRSVLMLAFTNTCWHGSKMRRFNNRGGHRPLTGTLYVPQLISEGNVYDIFDRKIRTLMRYYSEISKNKNSNWHHLAQTSATDLSHIKDNTVDYIFTDPPFGSNIFYADCNFLSEAWLGELTDTSKEAVVNKSLKKSSGGKSLNDYQLLLQSSFKEMSRVLKRGATGHIVFNNTEGEVWSSVIEAIEEGGLKLKKTHALDKIQKSVKGNKAANGKENVATIDLVLEFQNTKSYLRTASAKKSISHTELPKVVARIYPEFMKDASFDDQEFIDANFFSFFMAHCHTKRIDTSNINFQDVKKALKLSSESGDLLTA